LQDGDEERERRFLRKIVATLAEGSYAREVPSFKGEVRIELPRLLSGNICMRYIGCGEEHFAREVGAVVKYSAHEVNETDTSLKIAESARDILQMAPKPRAAALPSFIGEALVDRRVKRLRASSLDPRSAYS